jgi:hypothetical protein
MKLHFLGLTPESFNQLVASGSEGSTGALTLPRSDGSWETADVGDLVWFEPVEDLRAGRFALMVLVEDKEEVSTGDEERRDDATQHVWHIRIGAASGHRSAADTDGTEDPWDTPSGRRLVRDHFNALPEDVQSDLVADWFPEADEDEEGEEIEAEEIEGPSP